jgi:hypothetical protein
MARLSAGQSIDEILWRRSLIKVTNRKLTHHLNLANLPEACFWIVFAFADNSPGQ